MSSAFFDIFSSLFLLSTLDSWRPYWSNSIKLAIAA